MKKFRLFISLLIFSLLFLISGGKVIASEQITSFSSVLKIDSQAEVNVKETISYDFGSAPKRGIIRTIPLTKTNSQGEQYRINFQLNSITDQEGNAYKFSVENNKQNVTVKIGEEDKYVTGIKTYVIDYSVSGVITYFDDHDELYWNVTGNGWSVPILSSSARVILPQPVEEEKIQKKCYTGSLGERLTNCSAETDGQVVTFTAFDLGINQGLTIISGFPPGMVAKVEPERVNNFFATFWGKIIIVVFVVFVVFYYLISPLLVILYWFKFGRDPKVSGKPVRAWFDPPKDKDGRFLTPAEVGTLVDEHADDRDISATIIDLAVKGYLKIKEIKKGKDYEFIKNKTAKTDKLVDFEKKIFDKLFETKETVKSSALKENFYKVSREAKDLLYKRMVAGGYFNKDPQKVRNTFYLLAFIAAITVNLFLFLTLLIVGRVMPRKTQFGVVSKNVALGLANFLTSSTRQLKFQADKLYLFEKLLPFAIVFGVEKIWAERFSEIYSEPPSWFDGSYSGSFNSLVLVNSLNKVTTNISDFQSAPSSKTGSSGFSSGFSGGSSGGGFGGGGGGSW